jgi:hypothetical protein
MALKIPKIILYSTIKPLKGKTITVNEKENLEFFDTKRIYWINYETDSKTFSEHAHKTLEQIIIAINGKVIIKLESQEGHKFEYILQKENEGLYIPPMFWKKISYETPCILLCLASEEYDEHDYIRDYREFKRLQL